MTAYAHSITGEMLWELPAVGGVGGGGGGGGTWSTFDTEEGYTAYRNELTGEVSWTNPPDEFNGMDAVMNNIGGKNAVVSNPMNALGGGSGSKKKMKRPTHTKHFSDEMGVEYFQSVDDGETTWVLPEDAVVDDLVV